MKQRDRIVCLVGESGSGKTTTAKMLNEAGLNVIQSYTTRQPRKANEWGHTFSAQAPNLGDRDMIAYTFYNGHHYWATKEQYKGKGTSIYIIDPAGITTLKRRIDDAEIIIIYLKVESRFRRNRMLQDGRGIDDVDHRIFVDKQAFKTVLCDYVVDANGSIDEVVHTIIQLLNPT